MKALTLWQPWAWWVASGQKAIENRPWKPPVGAIGTVIAIHAGVVYDSDAEVFAKEKKIEVNLDGSRQHGAVLGVARIAGYVDEAQLQPHAALTSPWFIGPYGWLLEDVRAIATPVRVKGALGLWTLPNDVCLRVMEQLS